MRRGSALRGPKPPPFEDGYMPEPIGAPSGRVYRPIWDLGKEVLSTFLYVHVPNPANSPPLDQAETDLEALDNVVNDLSDIVQSGRKLLLALPVHYETLASSLHRRLYLRLCRTLPRAQDALLLFELVDVPEGIPPAEYRTETYQECVKKESCRTEKIPAVYEDREEKGLRSSGRQASH